MTSQSENFSASDLINEFIFALKSSSSAMAVFNSEFRLLWANNIFADQESVDENLSLKVEWDIDPSSSLNNTIISPKGSSYKLLQNKETKNFILHSLPSSEIKNLDEKKEIKKIAHDLSNILTNTLNSADLLKHRLGDKNQNNQIVDSIINSTIRSSEMIDALYIDDFEMGKQKYPVNIYNLISGLHQSISSSLPPNINFQIKKQESINSIICNSSEIYRVLLNLCTNAIEAMTQGGKLTISVNSNIVEDGNRYNLESGEYAYLEISDTGQGISEENLNKIFELNFSTKKKDSERGFGLNIVKEIIEDHNGSIEVESEENEGTTFRIMLPTEKKLTSEEFNGENKKILIAEDELHLLELLSELLASFNFEVIKAVDGEEVLKLFEMNTDLSLLIIDKKMPRVSGTECLEQIRKIDKDIPIIVASGSRGTSDSKFVNDPNSRFLKKPYNFDQLIGVVQELIG